MSASTSDCVDDSSQPSSLPVVIHAVTPATPLTFHPPNTHSTTNAAASSSSSSTSPNPPVSSSTLAVPSPSLPPRTVALSSRLRAWLSHGDSSRVDYSGGFAATSSIATTGQLVPLQFDYGAPSNDALPPPPSPASPPPHPFQPEVSQRLQNDDHTVVFHSESNGEKKEKQEETVSTTKISLDHIKDDQIRAVLDPNSPELISDAVLSTWSDERVIEFVRSFKPEMLEVLITKLIRKEQAEGTHVMTNVPTTLSWHNIHYRRRDGQLILQGLNGFIKPGMLCAVLGGADSGCTALLEILAGRLQSDKEKEISGEVLVNRQPLSKNFQRLVGYVPKGDAHLPMLTVSETLYFSCRLRQPGSSKRRALIRTGMIMQLLGLLHTWRTPIGDDVIRGISGGEKRRVSYALEIIANHNCIIADLPTNGLDSLSAYSLLQSYKAVNKIGRSMICSLVQPSPSIYALLDYVYVLSKGAALYFGPADQADNYFNSLGFIRPSSKPVPQFLEELSVAPEKFWQPTMVKAPSIRSEAVRPLANMTEREQKIKQQIRKIYGEAYKFNREIDEIFPLNTHGSYPALPSFSAVFNPSDHDDSTVSPVRTVRITRADAWRHLIESFNTSVFYQDIGFVLFHHLQPKPQFHLKPKRKGICASAAQHDEEAQSLLTQSIPHDKEFTFNASFWLQTNENVRRMATVFYRNKGLWLANWVKSVLIGLIIGTLFWNIGLTQQDVRTRFGLFYFMMQFNGNNANQLVPILLSFRQVFYLQKSAGYYHGLAYYLALIFVNIPIAVIESFLFIIIVYPMAGLIGGVDSPQFGFCFLMLILINMVSRSWVITLTSLLPTEALTNMLNGISLVLFSLFSGYMNPKSSIPSGWVWCYYTSYFTWSLRALTNNEHHGLNYTCSNPSSCLIKTGEDALALYDMNMPEVNKWYDVLWVSLFIIGFNILAAYAFVNFNWLHQDEAQQPTLEDEAAIEQLIEQDNQIELKELNQNNDASVSASHESSTDSSAASPSSQASHSFLWYNLNYSVPFPMTETKRDANGEVMKDATGKAIEIKTDSRQLLHDICGYARPGMLVALMGSSGAGKTTLLDVLAQKKTGGKITGRVLVDDAPIDHTFHDYHGYVEQFDSHNEKSTVREAIELSAYLRLPPSITSNKQHIAERVDHVLQQLSLTHVQHEIIGKPGAGGISQENRKKVTIAVELVMKPSILFLDECTTGLDSESAQNIGQCLKSLSKHVAIICTIHQPSQELISLFNYLCLLKPGGYQVYFGQFSQVVSYFNQFSHCTFPRYTHENIADHAIACVKIDGSFDSEGKKIKLEEMWRESAQYQELMQNIQHATQHDEMHIKIHAGATRSSFFLQYRCLLHRAFVSLLRSPDLIFGRIFAPILMGFIVSTCFFQLGYDAFSAQNRVSLIFLSCQFMIGLGTLALPHLYAMRPMVFRERQANMYDPLSFWLARLTSDIWLVFFETFIFSVFVYFVTNLNLNDTGHHFAIFYLIMILSELLGFGMIDIIGLSCASSTVAYAMMGAVMTILSLFSGFLIVKRNIPDPWIFMYYASHTRYALTGALQNEMIGHTFPECARKVAFNASQNICNLPLTTTLKCPVACGEEMLNNMGVPYDYDDMVQNIGIIAVYVVAYRIIAFFIFKYVNHVKR